MESIFSSIRRFIVGAVDRGVSVIRTVLTIIILFVLLMSIVDIYLIKTYGNSDWDITIHFAEYPTEVIGGENFTIVITGYVNIPQGEVYTCIQCQNTNNFNGVEPS